MPIQRLLVANRAEIASRVFRTCRRLGIETVAVHSDADAGLPYVREADVAVRFPGNAPSDTYLRIDLILDAAKRSEADAIHPGYGFLSESADFARAVIAAGLTWVGPSPDSIEQMGSKVAAKALMEAAGVPVLAAPDQPTEADLPLLVKASAGGGGRGIRIVRSLADLDGEIAAAQAEAASAFGDGTVFIEPYVEHGRHVEVQIWGDHHGNNISVLGARDCSIQRRHQKVLEEAPPPGLSRETLDALFAAAQAAGQAIAYVGVGTVEFLLDPATQRFWFLEMNTRLQVEHPVTEALTGVDLVKLQFDAAEDPTALGVTVVGEGESGHAIEVRLYAEDPASDWQPQSGLLSRFEIPEADGIRVDTGFESGSEVSTHYDAMLAKVVAHAPTREAAARKLADVLSRARIHGLVTNRDLLVSILRDPRFLAGEVSTDLLPLVELVERGFEPVEMTSAGQAPIAAALALAERTAEARTAQRGIPVGWRNVVSQTQVTEFEGGLRVEWHAGRDGYVVEDAAVVSTSSTNVTLERDGVRTSYEVAVGATGTDDVFVDSPRGHHHLRRVPRFTDPAAALASGSLLAPMPGTVVSVAVEVGQQVEAGQQVLVLEAMKMQHTVSAPHTGTVNEIDVQPGAQVAAGAVLAVVISTGSKHRSTSSTNEEENA